MATEVRTRNVLSSDDVPGAWGLLLTLGVLLLILGFIALSISMFATLVSVIFLGLLVLAAGISEVVFAFTGKGKRNFALHLFVGVLYGVAGFVMTFWPMTSALTLTLFIASMLLISGTVRLILAIVNRNANWGWAAFSATLSIILGIMIFNRWPGSGLWVIGLFIGVDLAMQGVGLIGEAFRVRRGDHVETHRHAYA
ncbi:MAG TPA: HdeD family acid-resistance protein [Bdellovibrionales bacterium]|nr:HdeD family acid-resistance protein [Bdellovibrionales bacterium]